VTRAATRGHARTRFVPTSFPPLLPLLRVADGASRLHPRAKRPPAVAVDEALRRYAVVMATARRTVHVELDERLVSRARAEARDATRSDDEIIEDYLSRYLLERLLDKTQQRADLSEEQATRLAVEELHAMRRERGAAA
jgi:hypothetical protein